MKAYRFRFYPTTKQRGQLAQYFGCARWVWNTCLRWRSDAYKNLNERVTGIDFSRELTWLKKLEPYAWLNDIPATIQGQVLRDQDKAFSNFFAKRAKYPRFKRREAAQSIRFQMDQRTIVNNYRAGQLLKLTGLGALKIRWSQLPAGIPKMVTVSKDAANRYFISFGCEENIESMPITNKGIGIDLGIKDVLVSSDGWKSGNPRHLNQKLRRLKRYQRRLARCTKGSNRRQKAKQQLARQHAKVADARRDWLQKQTTAIVRRADVIALEDLHVKGMLKNHCLARAISDVGLGEIRRQLEYKAEWYQRQVIIIDRFTPTSKVCSECGYLMPKLALSIREWICPECGVKHDRDLNAARNILSIATRGRPEDYARGGRKTPSANSRKAIRKLASNETRTKPEAVSANHGRFKLAD